MREKSCVWFFFFHHYPCHGSRKMVSRGGASRKADSSSLQYFCGMWVGVVYRYRTESLCGKGGKGRTAANTGNT